MLQPEDTDWLNGCKNKAPIYAVYKKPTADLKTHRLKLRGWKNVFHANRKQKKAEVAILISDKIDFKIKKITRDKEGHYIMIKGSIQEEDITIVNIYATSAGSWKKQDSSRKTSISSLLTMPKYLTVWITINCGKL